MASSEDGIRETLITLINQLVELALRKLGLWGSATPDRISVTVVWQIEIWWELRLPLVIDETRIGPEGAATLRTALGDLADRLGRVADTGGDAAAIRAEVLRFRDRWTGWARKAAITESTRIASEAALASKAAQAPGALKEWVTEEDSKVRASHRMIGGTRLPLSGSFQLPEGPLRYPGDPLGQPEEIINCRCGLKIVTRGTGA